MLRKKKRNQLTDSEHERLCARLEQLRSDLVERHADVAMFSICEEGLSYLIGEQGLRLPALLITPCNPESVLACVIAELEPREQFVVLLDMHLFQRLDCDEEVTAGFANLHRVLTSRILRVAWRNGVTAHVPVGDLPIQTLVREEYSGYFTQVVPSYYD